MEQSTLNRLAYFGDTEDGYSEYLMYLNDRVVFCAYANRAEAGCPIYIAKPGHDHREKTQFHAAVVSCGTRISSDSMKTVVYSQIVWFMADLYVPKD